MEQSAAAADSLQRQAKALVDSVAIFQLGNQAQSFAAAALKNRVEPVAKAGMSAGPRAAALAGQGPGKAVPAPVKTAQPALSNDQDWEQF